ncbi:hypothetical protein CDAR_118131 [Caerostris darwini]|uniref:Uncharacterized protein n=1 Tax=Caerostris darwini TaxID=1538125 RepID=A0AAV4TG42_9ARAC|nr:hypothetical protein CDAR_118131 [Caerostris darwini]
METWKPLRSVIQTKTPGNMDFVQRLGDARVVERERDSLMAGESLCGEESFRKIHARIVQRCSKLPVKRDSPDVRFTNLLQSCAEREFEFVNDYFVNSVVERIECFCPENYSIQI